jgi:hypothetical protein
VWMPNAQASIDADALGAMSMLVASVRIDMPQRMRGRSEEDMAPSR